MSNKYCSKQDERMKAVEKENLQAYNESVNNKVEPQNHEHNARMEGFARKEQNMNN